MSVTHETGVPLCDLKAQYAGLQPAIEAAVLRVLASGQVILGPDVAALEDEVAAYCRASHGVGCGSGTDAISLALHALDVGPGDEVLLPAYTFFATVGCVCRTGARPVLVDIDPQTFNIDPAQLENKVTPRTRAILAVHLFGQTADMSALWQVAERHHLPTIEDAAQALGAEYQGKRAGSLGLVGCLSFYPTKNLGSLGDAGMAVTSDPALAARMARLRVHGMEPKYHHQEVGWNARLDTVQAAILRVKLPHVERWIAARQQAAQRYDALIEDNHLTHFLDRPVPRTGNRHTFNQYVVRVAAGQRDALMRHLKADGIGCEVYYPIPLHLQECLAFLGHRAGDFPVSELASQTTLALPIFPEITEQQQERVIGSCVAYLRQQVRRAA
jgi:dTDP-4-amino-4,6-dideoxygalactose transaminase